MMYICPWTCVLILANSLNSDKMLQYSEFHLSLHCLEKYPFEVFQYMRIQMVGNDLLHFFSFKHDAEKIQINTAFKPT